MKFRLGSFYKHSAGRCIAILAEVESFKFGKVFLIEEVDRTGHSMSIADEQSEDLHGRWIEIGMDEWMKEFNARAPKSQKVFLN